MRALRCLIHNDEPEVLKRGKDGGTRSDDDAAFSPKGLAPDIMPLAERHPAVDNGNPLTEMAFETAHGLGRQ